MKAQANQNASSVHADAVIITCANNRLELTYDELTQIDNFLSRETQALNERVAKQTPPPQKFSIENPPDEQYLGPYIKRHNRICEQYNQRIAEPTAKAIGSTNIGRPTVSVNADGEASVSDGKALITTQAFVWRNERSPWRASRDERESTQS
jgi:hypothetical protein